MSDDLITDADSHAARFVAARWWWKVCNKLSRVGCWIRGYHLRRDGKFRRYCLQCGLSDERWRIGGKTDAEDAHGRAPENACIHKM